MIFLSLTHEIDVQTVLVCELLVDADFQVVVFVVRIVRVVEFFVLLHVGDQLEIELFLALLRVHRDRAIRSDFHWKTFKHTDCYDAFDGAKVTAGELEKSFALAGRRFKGLVERQIGGEIERKNEFQNGSRANEKMRT